MDHPHLERFKPRGDAEFCHKGGSGIWQGAAGGLEAADIVRFDVKRPAAPGDERYFLHKATHPTWYRSGQHEDKLKGTAEIDFRHFGQQVEYVGLAKLEDVEATKFAGRDPHAAFEALASGGKIVPLGTKTKNEELINKGGYRLVVVFKKPGLWKEIKERRKLMSREPLLRSMRTVITRPHAYVSGELLGLGRSPEKPQFRGGKSRL